MKTITLEAKKREETGKKMRMAAGKNIPAVVYGNDMEPGNLWVDVITFEKLFAAAGANTVISLVVDGAKPVNVLIYDFQTDPVTDDFTHVDFYAVNMKEEVEAEIPLVFVGVAAAVKELGGTLVKNNDTLVVRALPADLPHEIEVDITKLATFEDSITIEDVVVSDKVTIVLENEAVIASVAAPRTEEEIAELDSEVDADVSKVEGVADVEESEEGEDGEGGEDKKSVNESEEKSE